MGEVNSACDAVLVELSEEIAVRPTKQELEKRVISQFKTVQLDNGSTFARFATTFMQGNSQQAINRSGGTPCDFIIWMLFGGRVPALSDRVHLGKLYRQLRHVGCALQNTDRRSLYTAISTFKKFAPIDRATYRRAERLKNMEIRLSVPHSFHSWPSLV